MFSKEDQYAKSFKSHEGNSLRILLGLYKGNLHRFLYSGLFFLIKHSPAWLMPLMIARVVNAVIDKDPAYKEVIIVSTSILAVLVLLNIPMNYFHIHFSSKAIREVEAGLRSAIVRKLQQLSIAFHKSSQSGKLQSKIMRDVEAVQLLSHHVFVSLLNLMINISVSLTIIALSDQVVLIFFLMTIPVASLIIVFFRRRISSQNKRFRMEVEAASAGVMDMEEMIPVTRAHGLEKIEIKRMVKLVKNIADEGYRLDILQANFGSVSWAVFQLFQLACLVFTASLAIRGRILPGDVVLYQTYFTTIVTQVSGLIMLMPTIAKGLESIASIGEVMNAHDLEDNHGKLILEGLEGRYRFDNVTYGYGDGLVLKGLDLTVEPGETVAFVGASGAGKSTAMNLLIGFDLATAGHLFADGYDMVEINRRTYRKHIAVVPQNTVLFTGSIKDNIAYGLSEITEDEIWSAVEAANLLELVQELPEGLDTLIGEHGSRLSGGQRQRIAIARAVIRNPKIIFFDEATSALDSVSEKLILEALEKMRIGRTTFMVAHRLSSVMKADKICVLKEGVCVEVGTYDELMAMKGEFYRMKLIQS